MTVANVLLEETRVRLISDTLGYVGIRPAVLHRKVKLVPHLNAAFIVRGRHALAATLEHESKSWSSLTAAGQFVQGMLEMPIEDHFTDRGLAEVTCISMRRDRAVVERWVGRLEGEAARVSKIALAPGAYLSPSLGNQIIPAGMSEVQAFKVAILQQDIALKNKLNMCVGGDVELTEISAAGMSTKVLGEYPNKAATIEAIAAGELAEDILEELAA